MLKQLGILGIAALLSFAVFASDLIAGPSTGYADHETLLTDTRGQDRREDRGENRDDRQDCRQEEGRIGKDKRDCKRDDDADDA